MSKEHLVIRFLQIATTILTFILAYSIYCAKKGNIQKHKKINLFLVKVVFSEVVLLLVTLLFGFNYSEICKPTELLIHRCFSTPLFFSLIFATYYGWKNNIKAHKLWAKITVICWLGTLISAWVII